MIIGIIGKSCTGKSTLARVLSSQLEAEAFTGKDYLQWIQECFAVRIQSNVATAVRTML